MRGAVHLLLNGEAAAKMGQGLGVMADDTMVAIYGNLLMRAGIAFIPGWFA